MEKVIKLNVEHFDEEKKELINKMTTIIMENKE